MFIHTFNTGRGNECETERCHDFKSKSSNLLRSAVLVLMISLIADTVVLEVKRGLMILYEVPASSLF